jgi:hypothetical protein
MTLLDRYLAQCIAWCSVGQKAHAWKLANWAAQANPEQLADLPKMLTASQRSIEQ